MTDTTREPRHVYPHAGYFCAEKDCKGYINNPENRAAVREALSAPLLKTRTERRLCLCGDWHPAHDENNDPIWCRHKAAPPPAEAVEDALRDALYLDVEEAQGIIRKHGFVFARHLPDVDVDDLSPENEAARWEKLAFTLYGMLMPSGHRIERIRALLATPPEEEKS